MPPRSRNQPNAMPSNTRDDEARSVAEASELVERRHHRHALRRSGAAAYAPANAAMTKSQLPTLSVAPPVRPSPLVQPRASFAPTPIAAPPANAFTSRRAVGDRCAPRSVVHRSRPARRPDASPPISTPMISNTSQSLQRIRRAVSEVTGVERVARRVARGRGVAPWPSRRSRTRPTRRALGP